MQISKKPVEASVGSTALNIVNKLTGMFGKFLERLSNGADAVVFAIKTDKTPDNTPVKEWPYRCKVQYTDTVTSDGENDTENETDIFNIYLKKLNLEDNEKEPQVAKEFGVEIPVKVNGKTKTENGDSYFEESFRKYFTTTFDKMFKNSTGEKFDDLKEIEASNLINATFRKIQADDSINIELVSINASCSPVVALNALYDIVDDDEFIETIPEDEDVAYEIIVEDDGYDVNECECTEVDMAEVYHVILQKLYKVDLLAIHNQATTIGDNTSYKFEQVHWSAENQIQWFLKSQKSKLGVVESPISLIQSIEPMESEDISTSITELVNALDLYWCNFDHADQQMINSFINDWRTGAGFGVM